MALQKAFALYQDKGTVPGKHTPSIIDVIDTDDDRGPRDQATLADLFRDEDPEHAGFFLFEYSAGDPVWSEWGAKKWDSLEAFYLSFGVKLEVDS